MTPHQPIIILRIRPLKLFGIVTAELLRVASPGRFMIVEGTVHSQRVAQEQENLRQLALLCDELLPGNLYVRYANRKIFRHEKDFWETDDPIVKAHVKHMADVRLVKAVKKANQTGIPMLYASDEKTALHIEDQLHIDEEQAVMPVMHFTRRADGITYQLQLRIGDRLTDNLADRQLAVLSHQPGMFIIDGHIHLLNDNFSGQLLLPFVKKPQVDIPRKLEDDYFHRFILRHVTRAEIHAEGFDISDICTPPRPSLVVETAIDGKEMLSLRFKYGNTDYAPDTNSNGRVSLTAEDGSFRFTRQMRDKQKESEQASQLQQLTGTTLSKQGYIRFDSTAALVDWLRRHAGSLKENGFDVVQPSDTIYYIGPLNVEQNDSWQGDWLQTEVTIVLDDGKLRIPFRDLRETILRGEQTYMLPTGEQLFIPEEWPQRYANLLLTGMGMDKGKGFLRHRSQIGNEETIPARGEYAGASASSPPPLSPKLNATLRPYQQAGFEWLWQNFVAQTGCCLSDEMGLGKTLQTIALLLEYKEEAMTSAPKPTPGMLFSDEEMRGEGDTRSAGCLTIPFKTSLVVAPASVVHNWRNEISRFAPLLTVLTYTGGTGQRREKRLSLMRWDVVLTTYRTLLNDINYLARQQFGIIVFDESQAFKTATSQIHKAVSMLQAQHRLALSGTPVENNLGELWSLMNVLNPNLLGDARSFQQSFANPIARQMETYRRDLLRQLIAPFFLKRTKDEVLSDLPERQDEVVVCPMTDEQTHLYATELSKARNEWLDPNTKQQSRQINMLASIQRLRQIANGEGKMAVVFEQLEELRTTSHKVLLFSEYVSLLETVGEEMSRREWSYELLTGQTQHREQVIAHFQEDADCQFFLISLKAGGVGLNLTAADYVFLLDPWWNQSAEEQAIARAHRIGQHNPVFVYRFVSSGTLEEQILTLQERKQTLIDSVMPFVLQ